MPPGPAPEAGTKSKPLVGCLGIALCIFGSLCLIAGLVFGYYVFGNREEKSNAEAYDPVLWRNEPVDRIFPKFLGVVDAGKAPVARGEYGLANDPERGQWQRLGISPETGCEDALKGTTAKAAQRAGCKAALRATYTDPTGNILASVSVIVVPDDGADELGAFFSQQENSTSAFSPGVRAFPVPKTVAAKWSDPHANGAAGTSSIVGTKKYSIAAVTGAADGRKAGQLPPPWGNSRNAHYDRQPWKASAASLSLAVEHHLQQVAEGEA
ncbi:hypothetical protein [Streptomyces sp. HNM0574]|uniref:hypothetical protein n=1 Tax=Streptomyces sp. HNM0574 TaxID=2714954 RepID=UPI00146E8160|nr:hypothetical protein [Streptomyces sp. HNM0574]NLU69616.1 hypothetical protein [Streptomyces sp. HNM0574]